tara:strand:+ start:246 stop:461 length:216 start_codon:yes stop_codon:yes gene_type:complete
MNKLYIDIAERALSTFVQSFVAIVGGASVTSIDASLVESAIVAGIAAAASVVKTGLASKGPVGDDTGSLVG